MYSLGVKLPTKGRFVYGVLISLCQPWPSYSDDNDTRSYLGIFLLGPITTATSEGQKNVALDIFPPCKDIACELGYGDLRIADKAAGYQSHGI